MEIVGQLYAFFSYKYSQLHTNNYVKSQNIKELDQLLNAIRVGGAAGRAEIATLAAVAPGDGALSDIAALVGAYFFGPAGTQAGQAGGTAIEDAIR